MAVDQTRRIHILHTNDIHSHFEQMAKIETVLTHLRNEFDALGEASITVDVGDHLDRSRLETEGTQGQANRAVMEMSQYRIVTLGNNELLTFTKEDLENLYQDAPFTVLGTNITELDGKRPSWLQPWVIKELGGLQIGFLGVTIPFQPFYEKLGWQVDQPEEVLPEQVNQLRQRVDLVVLLSHLGLATDRRLAEQIPGIDVILGGHTHHLLEEAEQVGQTLIAAAGKFGSHLGRVTITFDPHSRKIVHMDGHCIPVANSQQDPDMVELNLKFYLQGNRRLENPIGTIHQSLPIDWYQESLLGNILADALRRWTGAPFSLVNAGQLLQGLEKGLVTRRHLHKICPHPINPCVTLLTGEAIRRTLEEALLKEYQELEIRGFGFRGKRLGILNLSGIQVFYRKEEAPYHKIQKILMDGVPLVDTEKYEIATVDMFTFGVGYLGLKASERIEYFLPELLRDVLASWVTNPKAIELGEKCRWIKE